MQSNRIKEIEKEFEANSLGNEEKIYEIFKELGIDDYKLVNHQPIFSVNDSVADALRMPGINCKSLLIKDKKKSKYFLVIIDDFRQMDQKHFKALTGWGKIRFAYEEELWEMMKLKPGSVGPYGLINDKNHEIIVVLDKQIGTASEREPINFHPNRNTGTLTVTRGQFMNFLKYLGNELIMEK